MCDAPSLNRAVSLLPPLVSFLINPIKFLFFLTPTQGLELFGFVPDYLPGRNECKSRDQHSPGTAGGSDGKIEKAAKAAFDGQRGRGQLCGIGAGAG